MPQPCLLIALFFEELSVNYPYRPKIRAGHFVLQVLLFHFPHLRCQSESLKSFMLSSKPCSFSLYSSYSNTFITSFVLFVNFRKSCEFHRNKYRLDYTHKAAAKALIPHRRHAYPRLIPYSVLYHMTDGRNAYVSALFCIYAWHNAVWNIISLASVFP